MNILKQVVLKKASRKADKSVSLQFITDLEQSPEALMEMDRLVDSRGILYYSDKGELTQEELTELDNVDLELEGKSMSQRLRSVLFVYDDQLGRQGEFKDFYKSYMNKQIENIKSKLD